MVLIETATAKGRPVGESSLSLARNDISWHRARCDQLQFRNQCVWEKRADLLQDMLDRSIERVMRERGQWNKFAIS